MADLVQYYGTGRRKSAIARVFLRPGTGEWKVNGKAFDVYFVTEQQRVAAKRTLALVEIGFELRRGHHRQKRRRMLRRPMPSSWALPARWYSSIPSCAKCSRPKACSPATRA